MKTSGIGGQAVLEGIMMKNKDIYAVAVRKPDGEIVVQKKEYKGLLEKSPVFQLPIVRGVVAFVESLMIGIQTLTYSASFIDEDSKEEKKQVSKKQESITNFLVVFASICMAVGLFIVLPYLASLFFGKVIASQTVLTLLEGLIRIVLFIGYIFAISRLKDIKRVFMYHGAEHKTINCIEHGLELTVKNVKRQTKQHMRCGTSFMLIVMFISIVFFIFIRVPSPWLRLLLRLLLVPVIAGVSYEFIKLAGKSESRVVRILSKPGLLLQRLTTKEPDDAMIEVAIQSVDAVFDWRAFIEQNAPKKERKKSQKSSKSTGKSTNSKSIKGNAIVSSETATTSEDIADGKMAIASETEDNRSISLKQIKKTEDDLKHLDKLLFEKESHEEQEEKKSRVFIDRVRTMDDSLRLGYGMTSTNTEEEDEILKALDRYFVTHEDKEENSI